MTKPNIEALTLEYADKVYRSWVRYPRACAGPFPERDIKSAFKAGYEAAMSRRKMKGHGEQ